MKYKGKILVVDDEIDIRESLSHFFKKEGYSVDSASSKKEALDLFSKYEYDVVFLDLKLPDGNGLDLLKEFLELNLESQIIVISAYGNIETAVSAIKLGAFDFLEKPFSIYQAKLALEKAIEKKKLTLENLYLKLSLKEKEEQALFIGEDPKIKQVLEKAKIIATTDSNILITGESGTGKGLLAKKIHEMDLIYKGPFVCVDCGSIVPTLFESELFGHVKGAFTGAHTSKIGKIELAQGGILFLDEIGNIPLDLQAKLLKVIDEKEFCPVGSNKIIKANLRIIAATNKNLKEEVKKGNFREDLYYRLNVVHFHLPPLRERKGDIPLLANYFLNYYSKKFNKNIKSFSSEAMNIFLNYDWPGNVRELKHLIERIVIFSTKNIITKKDLILADFEIPSKKASNTSEETIDSENILPLEEVEKNYILKVLKALNWNKSLASKKLGIDRKTLSLKLKKWNIIN
ncbi:sigma-54-dependent transcriptional regulator [Thermodesulfobacterium hydrogeniphilum]|uniref:sigma-54-dependent transcriptional regulator n=1 Tax=Thermodesulfobacterium hydrogeniphilum TaxID=161156 RepID=UPI000570975A|nr:sigma-54 dependent transcriptional regulator [Thermodesulfobacterium hydrogeniphilum]